MKPVEGRQIAHEVAFVDVSGVITALRFDDFPVTRAECIRFSHSSFSPA